ncbi:MULTISPECIES: phosphate acetyltransferase [Paracoccus]|uniref:phosphate acetyltransferase n=1 Tax=Paracoccus TaxID=265 RepID=UPI000780C199|nr:MULTISPECIES: phosphate acetyltransferase [Paracoccus]MCV2449599.1 phosphate acetyltransferase [Paracoccus sp. DMF]
MKPLDRIHAEARARARHIILPEGDDPRVAEAARRITEQRLARVTLMNGPAIPGVTALVPAEAPDLAELADHWHRLRAARGMTADRALSEMRDPIRQAAMRVRLGQADGTVGGAVATTADTVRAALQIIGKAPGAGIVSSFFLMLACGPEAPVRGGMIFSDCGLVIQPDAAELAAIARAAAASCRQLLAEKPRVALLSFSTAGSAEHPSLGRLREALALIRAAEPDLEVDGELQFDAALDEAIRAKKAPQSRLTGRPNVFIFPDLAAGNIGYKIAQRLGGLTAIGPILQGLARPANDLSRGCSVNDIVNATAITAIQAE